MAIYLNDRILKANPKGDRLEREYAEGLNKVTDLFDRFRRKGEKESDILIGRKLADKDRVYSMNTHKQKRLPTVALPVEVPYYDEEMGATLIRYSSTPPTLNTNGGLSWSTKYIEFREFMSITEKQKDLAWFMLFASNLVRKGVYQLVDTQAKYEGTFNEIMLQKTVTDSIIADPINEELVRHIAQSFISESMGRLDAVEMAVKTINWVRDNNKWEQVLTAIKKFKSSNVLGKEKISEIEWEGEPVEMKECPVEIKFFTLKAEAQSLGIRITSPPQTKNVLYSLIQHVKEKNAVLNE